MEHVTHRFVDLFEGRLDRGGQEAVEQHLSQCASCSSVWLEMQTVISAPKEAAKIPSSTYFTSILPHVRERLENRKTVFQQLLSGEFVERLLMPLAFAIIVTISLSRISWPGAETTDRQRRIDIAPQEMAEFISSVDAASAGEFASVAGLDDRLLLSQEPIAPVSSAWEEIDPTSLQDDLDMLGDEESQDLINRLGKRTTL